MPKSPKQRLLPLPLDPIVSQPALSTMTVAELGAYAALVLAYWLNGCRPLPTEESRLAVIARCSTKQWWHVRGAVLALLTRAGDGYTVPGLPEAYAKAMKARVGRQAIAIQAGHASAAARKRQVQQFVGADCFLTDPGNSSAPRQPTRLPRRPAMPPEPKDFPPPPQGAPAQKAKGLLCDKSSRK